MNKPAKQPTELSVVELSPADRAELALKSRETENTLRGLVAGVSSIQSVTSADGRTECHAAYMSLRNARVAIETTGKKAREDATAFSKAVIAEEKKLVAIVDAEETRLKALRDEWDAAREAERQALIEAERARVAALRAILSDLGCLPATLAGSPSQAIREALAGLSIAYYLEQCAELADEVATTYSAAVHSLEQMISEAEAREAAEAARLAAEAEAKAAAEAEAARVAAESERLAREREAFEAEQAKAREAAEQAAREAEAEARAEADRLAEERRKLEAERLDFEEMRRSLEQSVATPALDEQPDEPGHITDGELGDEFLQSVEAELETMVDDVFQSIQAQTIEKAMTLEQVVDVVCGSLPAGYVVSLSMENGAAWVMLLDIDGKQVDLPDSAGKSIAEQLGDAITTALYY